MRRVPIHLNKAQAEVLIYQLYQFTVIVSNLHTDRTILSLIDRLDSVMHEAFLTDTVEFLASWKDLNLLRAVAPERLHKILDKAIDLYYTD